MSVQTTVCGALSLQHGQEMNAADRFSFVILEEENLLNGNLEDITIEGVSDVLTRDTSSETKGSTAFYSVSSSLFGM